MDTHAEPINTKLTRNITEQRHGHGAFRSLKNFLQKIDSMCPRHLFETKQTHLRCMRET
jgi:hypothetical protein